MLLLPPQNVPCKFFSNYLRETHAPNLETMYQCRPFEFACKTAAALALMQRKLGVILQVWNVLYCKTESLFTVLDSCFKRAQVRKFIEKLLFYVSQVLKMF